jgi:predicted O-methyltransferase YrrM
MDETRILTQWNRYIEENLLPLIKSQLEGNLYSKHKSTEKCGMLIPKQRNMVNIITKIRPKRVLEIGFNAGFSALLMKMTSEQIGHKEMEMTCVDINVHPYVTSCYKRISQDHKNIKLVIQSSHDYLKSDTTKYDLIHIDGDHNLEGAEKDLVDSLKLSHKGTIIIFDDTNLKPLNDLCDRYVKTGVVKEHQFPKINGTTYNHRFLEVI